MSEIKVRTLKPWIASASSGDAQSVSVAHFGTRSSYVDIVDGKTRRLIALLPPTKIGSPEGTNPISSNLI